MDAKFIDDLKHVNSGITCYYYLMALSRDSVFDEAVDEVVEAVYKNEDQDYKELVKRAVKYHFRYELPEKIKKQRQEETKKAPCKSANWNGAK